MPDLSRVHFAVMDGPTAATLAQVLPVLLLSLMVEVRRTRLHLSTARKFLGIFFLFFALAETVMVLSIDGEVYPFQWSDLIAALLIFGLITMLYRLSVAEQTNDDRDL
jgi:Ca2+/Na+ antiporter